MTRRVIAQANRAHELRPEEARAEKSELEERVATQPRGSARYQVVTRTLSPSAEDAEEQAFELALSVAPHEVVLPLRFAVAEPAKDLSNPSWELVMRLADPGGTVSSPTHSIAVRRLGEGQLEISARGRLEEARADLVIRFSAPLRAPAPD